jgi:hypothetical protein
LHCVRALGFSTNFSWNFGRLEINQIKASFDRFLTFFFHVISKNYYLNRNVTISRYDENDRLGVQNIVPLRTLVLDVTRELLGNFVKSKVSSAKSNLTISLKQKKSEATSWIDDITKNPKELKTLMLMLGNSVMSSVSSTVQMLSRALISTGHPLVQENGTTLNDIAVHCAKKCKREIFEVYLSCPKCGYLCLLCSMKETCNLIRPVNAIIDPSMNESKWVQYHEPKSAKFVFKTHPEELVAHVSDFINVCNSVQSAPSPVEKT